MADKKIIILIPLPEGQLVRDRDVLGTLRLYNELALRKQFEFFPGDMPPPVVHDHLVTHLRWVVDAKSATREQRMAAAQVHTDEARGREMVGRLTHLVDGVCPPGHRDRERFFPTGPGPHATSAELSAFAAGMAAVGLAMAPEDLAEPLVRQLAGRLAAAEVAEAAQSEKRGVAQTSQGNLTPRTREIKRRLGDIVRGYYGPYSPELAAYGLKVRSRIRRRKARAVAAPKPVSATPINGHVG